MSICSDDSDEAIKNQDLKETKVSYKYLRYLPGPESKGAEETAG